MPEMYMYDSPTHMMFPRILRTIQQCAAHCEHMTKMLLHTPDVSSRASQLELLRDCADICEATAKYIARNSMFSTSLVRKCARICEICGNECLRFPDQASQICARICLHCAQECRAFIMASEGTDPNWE